MTHKILVINPGSTSTKVAVFENETLMIEETISHPSAELKKSGNLWEQFSLRQKTVVDFLQRNRLSIKEFSAVVGRGGLLRPLEGGTYRVNEHMIADARQGLQGEHAANLGCALAQSIADKAQLLAYVVDPVSVDEFEPLARYSGHPLIERRSLSHTLNIHAVARAAAEQLALDYNQATFIVAHLGGGISISPVKNGRIIDVNDASSDGPFSPDRTGGLPLQPFISLCFSGKYTEAEMRKLVMGQGGLLAYLNTNDAQEIERRIAQGDQKALEVYQAMAYQIAKEIGAMATVVKGQVKAIVLTGGLAKSEMLVNWIKERVSFIAEVLVFPDEFEMQALALGALRVLRGEEIAKNY